MRNKIKKIRIRNKYDFSFLLKPLTVLSVISAFAYGLEMLDVRAAKILMPASLWSVVIVSLLVRAKNPYKRVTVILLAFIGAILYVNIYDEIVIAIAEKCANGGVKFGIINTIFSTFGLNEFENMIFHTSYGGAKIINGTFVTGAADIFMLNPAGEEAALFLCGKYLSLFAAAGIAFSLGKQRKEVLFITLFAFLTGDLTVFLIMLLLVFTPFYFVFLLSVFFCYLIASADALKSGFAVNASVFELFLYGDNILYILILGVFICAVVYYCSGLVKEKYKW